MKTALAKATLLTHPDPSAPYCLMVNASNVTTGGVLTGASIAYLKATNRLKERAPGDSVG